MVYWMGALTCLKQGPGTTLHRLQQITGRLCQQFQTSLVGEKRGYQLQGGLSSGWGFPGGSDGEEPTCHAGDAGLTPGSGRSLGEGNGNPLQYPCLVNPTVRGSWQALSLMSERVGHD